ncbi:class IIb bacteriocin, lactobin A/cerein 7B family [Kordia sp. TARA_039_SRF]|nr:class IIb bacteriocin, lactobin A/cerein 7B family [Kordia sp. TARA_039_SRF]
MEFTKQQQEGQELMNTLIAKAWESPEFKQQLISNPNAAIEQVTGKKLNLDNSQRIVVEDQTDPNTIYLNIPRQVDVSELELSDEQLEMVAGGVAPIVVYGGIFLVGVIAGALAE